MKRIQVRMGETVKWSASLVTLFAAAVAPLLSCTPVRAEWAKSNVVVTHYGQRGGNYTVGYGNFATVAAIANDAGAPSNGSYGASSSVEAEFAQNFVWNGGGTSTPTFNVVATGEMNVSATSSGNGSANASSTLTTPITATRYAPPGKDDIVSSGPRTITRTTATTALDKIDIATSAGGFCVKPGGGFTASGQTTVTYGNPY